MANVIHTGSARSLVTSRVLLTGLVVAVAALIVAGCGGKEEGPVTAASSKYQVDDNSSTPASAASTPSASMPDASAASQESPAPSPAPSAGGPSPSGATAVPAGDVPAPPTTPPIGAPTAGGAAYPVPEGKEALLAFLQQLQRQQPKGQNQQELLDDYRAIHAARIQAADKLLKESQEKQPRLAATQSKLEALRSLMGIGDRQAEKDLNGYGRIVTKDPDPEIAHTGRLMLFDMSLDALANGEMKETQTLLAELKKLIADKPDAPGVFVVIRKAAIVLQQVGHREAALDAYQAIGNAYKDSQEPQLATEARAMLDMAKAQTLEVKLDLDGKLKAMLTDQPNSAPPVLEVVKALLGIESPGEYVLNVAAQVAQLMEISGNVKEAGEAFALLETAFKDSPNKELAEQAAARAENGRRRAALIGQPFVVDGSQADGSPFDWGKYQGKVVLVDFWATWCQPCLQEMPNLKQNYEKYRDKGFEVVGVNIDEDPQMVQRFLALQPLPWTTVISADANARGFEHPLAVKCGIDAIPFLVLIGRDGKVSAIHVGGEKLEQKLAQMLGPAAPATPTAPAEKPAVPPPGTGG